MDEDEVVKRLDKLGYSPEANKLLAWNDRFALLLTSTRPVILELGSGREHAVYTERRTAERAFNDLARGD